MSNVNEIDEKTQETNEKVANRRAFLRSAGFTGLGLASAGIMAGQMGAFENNPLGKALGMKTPKVMAAETANADIDVAILNFALNLEYLEAEFYTTATTGLRMGQFDILTCGVGTEGPTIGGHKVDFTIRQNLALGQQIAQVAEELTYDEQAHVKFLRAALGKYAVAKPTIDLTALGIGFDSVPQFLTLARAFEDTGMSAYDGAAPLITSKAYLAYAAQIALTEANHSGAIRQFVALTNTTVPALDSLDVVPPPAGKNYFNVSKINAFGSTRTTSQVLSILYGSSVKGTSKGGFFPDGLNGVITAV